MKEISQSYEVKKGDIIEFHYKILTLFTNYQINSLISKLEDEGKVKVLNFEVKEHSWLNDILILRCEVIQNPFPLALIAVAIGGIATSIFLYLSLDKIYLISESLPEIAKQGLGALAIIGSAFGAILLLKKFVK